MRVALRELTPITGPPIPVPDPSRLTHLQFRRFAGCPVCNLHIQSLLQGRDRGSRRTRGAGVPFDEILAVAAAQRAGGFQVT